MRYEDIKILNENYDKPLVERVLENRNIEDKELFLNGSLKDAWIDPFRLAGMDLAVKKIVEKIKYGEKIMIFGDYDVDGITSTTLLYSFLTQKVGYKKVEFCFPDRQKDGYGLKDYHVHRMKEKGASLIITVDNGITSLQEAKIAKELGIDLIITDHHHPLEEIPDALAVINPKVSSDYPFKDLAGVGVAYKLLSALLQISKFSDERKKEIFMEYLPLVAIGTVADIVPLVGENRFIVKNGLAMINSATLFNKIYKPVRDLITNLNLKRVDTYHIGFVIGPRINASGRIGSAYDSIKVLLTDGSQQLEHIQKMEENNSNRRDLQEDIFSLATANLDLSKNFLFAGSKDFHEGVVGIVAGRITDLYNRPSFVFKINEQEGIATGSFRGPDYFNVVEMLQAAQQYFIRFGGHKQAGGATIPLEKLQEALDFMTDYCEKNIDKKLLKKIVKVDTKILKDEWISENLEKLDLLSPFGEGNPEPTFVFEDIQISDIKIVGNGNGHLKVFGKYGDNSVILMWRRKSDKMDYLLDKGKISVIGKVKKDNFSGGWYVDVVDEIE